MGVVSICPGYLTTTHFHGPGIRGKGGGLMCWAGPANNSEFEVEVQKSVNACASQLLPSARIGDGVETSRSHTRVVCMRPHAALLGRWPPRGQGAGGGFTGRWVHVGEVM